MKKIITFFSIIVLLQTANAQDLDHLMTRRYISCPDIEYNCSFLIPDYYQRGLNDSLNYVLEYWENRCGISDLLYQTKTLVNIKNRTFNEKDINDDLFTKLVAYRKRKVNNIFYSGMYSRYYPSDYTNGLYNSFLESLSNDILNQTNLTLEEKFITDLYSNKTKLSDLATDKYAGNRFKNQYEQFVDSIKHLPEFTFTIYSGFFITNQSVNTIGNNGIIGFGFGGIFNKNSIDMLLDFKFGGPKKEYDVLYKNSVITTNEYTGMYVGLEYGRTLLSYNNSEYYLSGGLGGERITAIARDDENDIDPKFLWSPNYSVGMGYRYRYNYKNYLSFQFRYQHLDFDNPSGTKLEGNTFTLRVLWIISSNGMKSLLPKL
ncbi:hypothetical protein [Carboxylicivirga caseinilyticus]|uniref:hypothetical protein n=1 Tax=Carboxylicivirga caseinilyticus TaxID=3417572 RepID=UPI003D326347|nr:hypothetical protein [Marinilabiliaceae bacterium A049]